MQSDANAAGTGRPPVVASANHEQRIVFLLCLLGAIHVFIFSAAFPFFTNLDETSQFDLALKYSHGHFPRKTLFSPDSSVYLTLFSSCAYLGTPDMFPDHRMPDPLWTEPPGQMHRDFTAIDADWKVQNNYEISQAPLYYILCGAWWRAGHILGFQGGRLLYWLRFLNILLVAGLVWLGYRTARIVFPQNSFVRLGVPAVIAVMPQSAFYSIENDVLSALCFGLLFLCVLKGFASDNPTVGDGIAAGAAFAATYLAKATNLPLLAVAAAALLLKMAQGIRQKSPRPLLPFTGAFLGAAVPPIAAWMAWCEFAFGDLFGSKLKMAHEYFGWTIKPFAQWWHHPIFTPRGAWTYFSGQMGTFWQGEFLWHNQPMALPGTDAAFSLLSLALLLAALPALMSRPPVLDPFQRRALRWAFACFAVILAFFAFLSIIYDFHNCPNPSRAHPYFHAGRMMLGALVPFLLLIVCGLDRLLNRLGNPLKYGVLAAALSGMLLLEIATDWPAFSSSFNWFHLP